MKTRFTLVMILMAALVACQKESKVEINPTYDPDENTVNTQFVLSISSATGAPQTKQTAVDVQASGANFRGLVDAHLVTYKLAYHGIGNAHYLYDIDDPSSVAVRDYDLGVLATADDINEDDSRRILELALPLGTNNVLVVGRAPTTGDANTQGSVTYSGVALGENVSNIAFTIDSRMGDTEKAAFKKCGELLGGILTFIMRASRENETTANGYKTDRDNTYSFIWPLGDENGTLYEGSKTWKEYGDTYASNPTSLKPLEEVLGEAYNEVMHLKVDKVDANKVELRAGASVTIVRLVTDMYNIISRVVSTTPNTPEEYIAQLVAQEAYARAALFFDYDEGSSKLNFRERKEIMDGVDLKIKGKSASDYSSVTEDFFYYSKTGSEDKRKEYDGFPMNMGMPSGSALMTFEDKTNYIEVSYLSEVPTYGMGSGSGFPIENYLYPAELTYYVNSSLRTSDTSVEKSTYPAVSGNWSSDSYWPASVWKGDEVTSSTRSVAVAKTINYGTALLKSQFAFKESTVEDNNGGVHPGEINNSIDVTKPNKFLVSGIIIGGVNATIGWNFLPKGTNFNKMIYDNLNGQSLTIPVYTTDPDKRFSDPVYTCTWDNYNASLAANAQQKVYIGLELVNNTGEDLWAELNLIRNGGTFYLVGELDPTATGVADNLKKNGVIDLSRSDCFYPPFDTDGSTINAPRVFMQDYVTNVKFMFAKDALKHAYVTMPDLRSGQVSLGLSVDLTWEKGLEFTVDMGNVSGN